MRLSWETGGSDNIRRWILPAVIGALIGLVAFLVVMLIRSPRDAIVLEVSRQPGPDQVSIWVGGEVAQPGLYHLPRGSRVADAIEAAGGLTTTADGGPLEMAALLADADEIVVPGQEAAQITSAADAGAPNPTATNPLAGEPTTTLIDINSADSATLERLPGIGPALAGRIIDYREANGGFTTVDELEVISGISARMVEEFRPYITAGQ